MRHCFIILVFIILAPVLTSCFSHVDGFVLERDIALRLVTDNPKLYDVYLKRDNQEEKIPSTSGIYRFRTPRLRWGQAYLFNKPGKSWVHDIEDFFKVKDRNNTILSLSCEDILNLPKDDKGISELRF